MRGYYKKKGRKFLVSPWNDQGTERVSKLTRVLFHTDFSVDQMGGRRTGKAQSLPRWRVLFDNEHITKCVVTPWHTL